MKSMKVLGLVSGASLLAASVGAVAQTTGASGIDPTTVTGVITDGQAKGLVIGLAMLALVVVFKIVKKVRSAA